MKILNFLLITALIVGILTQSLVIAQLHEVDYSVNPKTIPTDSSIVVQVIKYEPYPVSSGEWFDLWVKVQNIGQADSQNTVFQLLPEYPFSSNDSLVRNYGLLYGTANAYKVDQTSDSSQVILKYRVKVADNAPEGDSNIKFQISTDSASSSIYNLPITIGKTKTDFDVVMQDSNAQGVSFGISNIGSNDATAVTVKLKPQDNIVTNGASSSIIGNLAKGDYTTVTFSIASNPTLKQATIQISYTDTAGVRNTIEKDVPVNIKEPTTTVQKTSSASKYIYLVLGIFSGFIIVFVYRKIRRKK